jgi:hypothetical protein
MALTGTIDRSLRSVFSALSDLAFVVEIQRKAPVTFDFALMSVGLESEPSLFTKAVEVKSNREPKTRTTKRQLLVQNVETGLIDGNTSLVINGIAYPVTKILVAGPFITLVEVDVADDI